MKFSRKNLIFLMFRNVLIRFTAVKNCLYTFGKCIISPFNHDMANLHTISATTQVCLLRSHGKLGVRDRRLCKLKKGNTKNPRCTFFKVDPWQLKKPTYEPFWVNSCPRGPILDFFIFFSVFYRKCLLRSQTAGTW